LDDDLNLTREWFEAKLLVYWVLVVAGELQTRWFVRNEQFAAAISFTANDVKQLLAEVRAPAISQQTLDSVANQVNALALEYHTVIARRRSHQGMRPKQPKSPKSTLDELFDLMHRRGPQIIKELNDYLAPIAPAVTLHKRCVHEIKLSDNAVILLQSLQRLYDAGESVRKEEKKHPAQARSNWAGWYWLATGLYGVYFRKINIKAGWSHNGPAARFVAAVLERVTGETHSLRAVEAAVRTFDPGPYLSSLATRNLGQK
jgi:hypothetical protein